MDIKQLIDIAVSESNDRDLETIDKEKNIQDQREENMSTLITEKAKLQIMHNDIVRKQLYLDELKKGNRIDELRIHEENRRAIQIQIDRVIAEYAGMKAQKTENQNAMTNIIRQMEEEQSNKKRFEIAKDYYTYHSSKRELVKVREEKQGILAKPIFEHNEQVTFIGLENKIDKLKLKINKSELDIKAAERESIEAAALLDKNEKDKKDLEAENERILKSIKSSFMNEYPEGTNLLERYILVKERVKALAQDLNSANFAKNEFLMGMLEGSKVGSKCLLCDGEFSEDCYTHRKEFFESTLKKPTEEEERSFKELEDFKLEYETLKKFKPDLKKLQRNNERILEIDAEIERMFSDAGRKQHKITQASDVSRKLKEEELELKDMQLLISREDELEKIIREIDVSRFQGEDEELLYKTYEKGQSRPGDLTNMLSDKQKSLCIIEHNMSTLDDRLSDLHRQSREIGGKIQLIKEEQKEKKSVEEIEHDLNTSILDLEERRAELIEKEKAMNAELVQKDAEVKVEKALLSRLNYLIPDLQKRHNNLMKLNTSNVDESVMMTNYRKFKDVELTLDRIKTEVEEKRKEQEMLSKRIKLISDKILLMNTEEIIRTKENEILTQTEELRQLAGKVEKEKQMTNEFIKLTANVSNMEGKDETHKKSAQEYYDKIYRNRDKEMQYFERLTHYEYYRMLVDDLELYMQSLEEALVKYHREKIELINKNIAELWKMTYQNGDIKRIEIKAEQIVDGTIENKGNFNYRVVFYNKE